MAARRTERRGSQRARRVATRVVRQRFLIVCEGEQTEPKYFRAFQVPGLVVTIASSARRGAVLIAYTVAQRDAGDYDQTWCVFDRDDLTVAQIDEAFRSAAAAGVQIAFSNQAFELWLLLHFDYQHTALDRASYRTRLDDRLGVRYDKRDPLVYDRLLDRQPTAIANATRLRQRYPQWQPAHDDPATTIHELVLALNAHRRL